ncbi:hypothetical protein J437_LFUL005061 [Ladona fulva]|uniref:General transcription factor 3C polypeptide 5 n=1 Tax=Ladona fulva TaxID=123851 RepID=A0A8K0KPC3_LADFU|nr:hypothetical protein J437_LFUL005061 [Ladona fulva]
MKEIYVCDCDTYMMSNSSEMHNLNRELICIEYPGVVKNVDKMFETLGGLKNISSVYSQKRRRLELRFRPNDIFSKPACGDRHSTSALLLRVKVRRKKKRSENGNNDDDAGEVVSCEASIVGQISTVYRFTGMCDFQYLPAVSDSQGKLKSIYEEVVPIGVRDYSWLTNPDVSLFVPPPSFSRMDMPQSYSFRRGKSEAEYLENFQSKSHSKSNVFPRNIIGRTRCRRSLHTISLSWTKLWAASGKAPRTEANRMQVVNAHEGQATNSNEISRNSSSGPSCSSSVNQTYEGIIPVRPQETAVRLLRIKFLCGEPFLRIQKYLEERPVWSKNALLALTKLTADQLKYLLPAVSYYFLNGPWRGTWARFGYDPTKHPSARLYQTLDFRLRRIGGMKSRIKAKRSTMNCSQPYKWVTSSRPKIPVVKKIQINPKIQEEIEEKEDDLEANYIFRPGMLPPSMQMFYQYCDLQVPEIQALLEKLPQTEPDAVCTERTGWLPAGFDEKCRDIITDHVMRKLREMGKSS